MLLTFDERKLRQRLASTFPQQHRAAAQTMLKSVAKDTLAEVRKQAPRRDGVLHRALYVKPLRDQAGRPPAVDVRVRTGKRYQASADGKRKDRDAFYWRFLEFGTKHILPVRFVEAAKRAMAPRLRQYFGEYRAALKRKG
jgi:HK97 gp10 family phage protein